MVNPAILGDEYLYSLNARKAAPWDAPVAGDFSNYLFNFVYQTTNLCGPNFYSCSKVLNITFFLGFIYSIFLLVRKSAGYWPSYLVMVGVGLSPLNIYPSMFLPESLYFFLMSLVALAIYRALARGTFLSWGLVGSLLGVASLVKPHAWLSFIAIAVAFTVLYEWKTKTILNYLRDGLFVSIAAVATRVVVGFLVAGPKALSLFGQYVGTGTVETLIEGPLSGEALQSENYVGAGPLAGVEALFLNQFSYHLTTIMALGVVQAIAFAMVIVQAIRHRELQLPAKLVLMSGIWLLVLLVEIVIFTGWVTGGGDDHTFRLLLRYYEFMIPISLATSIGYMFSKSYEPPSVFIRWLAAAAVFLGFSPAFSGLFNQLSIQIADAPSVAGLIVNQEVFTIVGVLALSATLVFATFPKYLPLMGAATSLLTAVYLGIQTSDQYQIFRGGDGPLDSAGKEAALFLGNEKITSKVKIFANSRFDATGAAFWVDRSDTSYEVVIENAVITSDVVPDEHEVVLTVGRVELAIDEFELVSEGDGFKMYVKNILDR